MMIRKDYIIPSVKEHILNLSNLLATTKSIIFGSGIDGNETQGTDYLIESRDQNSDSDNNNNSNIWDEGW